MMLQPIWSLPINLLLSRLIGRDQINVYNLYNNYILKERKSIK